MTPTMLDHGVVALLALAVPVLGAAHFRRLKARLAAGVPDVRIRQYRRTIVMQVLTAAAVTAAWSWSRPVVGLFTLPGPAGWLAAAGWAATAAACVALVLQVVMVRDNEEGLSRVREQLAAVEDFLPHARREVRLFYGLSLTAGICEQIVYRGFLMAYLLALGGMLLAVLGSALVFGLAHAYQGPQGMARTGAIGLVLAALYGATGNLLAPMALHIVIDVTSGTLAHLALSATGRARTPTRQAASP